MHDNTRPVIVQERVISMPRKASGPVRDNATRGPHEPSSRNARTGRACEEGPPDLVSCTPRGGAASDTSRDGDIRCSVKINPTRRQQVTGTSTRHAAIRHASAGVRIYKKDPTPIPVPIANQPRGHDQGATEHIVRRFARGAPLPHLAACVPPDETRLETAPTGRFVPLTPTRSSTSRLGC